MVLAHKLGRRNQPQKHRCSKAASEYLTVSLKKCGEFIRTIMRDPESLQIHDTYPWLYEEDQEAISYGYPVSLRGKIYTTQIDIDYSAKNGFGGRNRGKLKCYLNKDAFVGVQRWMY